MLRQTSAARGSSISSADHRARGAVGDMGQRGARRNRGRQAAPRRRVRSRPVTMTRRKRKARYDFADILGIAERPRPRRWFPRLRCRPGRERRWRARAIEGIEAVGFHHRQNSGGLVPVRNSARPPSARAIRTLRPDRAAACAILAATALLPAPRGPDQQDAARFFKIDRRRRSCAGPAPRPAPRRR